MHTKKTHQCDMPFILCQFHMSINSHHLFCHVVCTDMRNWVCEIDIAQKKLSTAIYGKLERTIAEDTRKTLSSWNPSSLAQYKSWAVKKIMIKSINTKSSKLHTAKSWRKFCNSLYQNERTCTTCAQELKEETQGHVI